jgi:hypothetical protein
MKRFLIAITVVISLSLTMVPRPSMGGTPYASYTGKFLPGAMIHVEPPTGHTPGKDNYITSNPNRFHMQGEDCGICHAPGKKAENVPFTMSGTFYKDKTGREPLAGAEVILVDAQKNVISMTSNEAGNFFTQAAIAADPKAFNNATSSNPRAWRYKAWVKYGDHVVPMVTIAPVGGMSAPRMSCNMHHAPKGSRGALFAGIKPTLREYPTSNVSFKKHVLPILKIKCKSCHMPRTSSTGNMATYSTTWGKAAGKYQYDGGLNLMTYATTGAGGISSTRGISDVVNTSNPDYSPLFMATVKGSTHAGGWFWTSDDADYKVIRQWIAEGAQNNLEEGER